MGKFTQELEELRQQPLWLHLLITKHLKTEVRMLAPHALKGQKLLAQGSALGIIAIGKAPCKGKSLINLPGTWKLLPLQGDRFALMITQGVALG